MPTDCVLSPAKAASGSGASAVYIYKRKKRPYTVRIITKESTVMNKLPRIVTSHSGMLARSLMNHTTVHIIMVHIDTLSNASAENAYL